MARRSVFKMAAEIFKPCRLAIIMISCYIFLSILGSGYGVMFNRFNPESEQGKKSMNDITMKCWRKIEEIQYIKQLNVNSAAFEVGYLVQIIQDKYRKMVDRYHTCKDYVGVSYYIFEILIYLEEIEHHYWQLEHLISASEDVPVLPKLKLLNETILDNAPWTIKLLMLKDQDPLPTSPKYRRVGVEALIQRRQDSPSPSIAGQLPSVTIDGDDDENNMRLKLFRLMYETVRDSDLKVKRAELIRKHYTNSSSFEVGFLMGEVQEKFDIIQEFSGTLQKFYDTWKPIEHINAYEQIANYAIQVNHLVDLVRSIGKNST